jgi:hypothetical protein
MSSSALSRRILAAVLAAAIAAGCGGGSTGATPNAARSPAGDQKENSPVRLQITIGNERLTATLRDSAASRDLVAQLPLTVAMVDHGGVEKTGPLPAPLSLAAQPEGADPDVGDVGYYAPGNDLVLYYGDQSFFPGIVVLGHMDGDAAARIAATDGPVTATVEEG